MRSRWRVSAAVLLLFRAVVPLDAVVFGASGAPDFNTDPPAAALAHSGWQWTGRWGGFQGVAIGPHHFLTARHVGGVVGDAFVLGNQSYRTIEYRDDPRSELRVWRIAGEFPTWAPLYRRDDEIGRVLLVCGRGAIRGAEVRVTGELRGWQWSPGDGRMRWGLSRVAAIRRESAEVAAQLYAVLDRSVGPNAASLATGDSSAPVFVFDGRSWCLAGIAGSVDGPFRLTGSGEEFLASLFDCRGLYCRAGAQDWRLINGPRPVATGFYSTRISSRASWLDIVTGPTATPAVAP